MKSFKQTTVLSVLMIGLTACSSKPDFKEYPKSANAKQELSGLEVAIENSRANDLGLLAPVSYKDARSTLKEAQEMEKDDKSDEKVLNEVALGHAYLERAQRQAVKTRNKIQDVLVARKTAMDAKADAILPQELAKIDGDLKKQIVAFENKDDNKLDDRRAMFIAAYTDLELRAIKHENIGDSRAIIDASTAHGAANLTPTTLAAANKAYAETDAYISEHRHDTAEIKTRAAATLVEAKKLESTLAAASGLTAATPEQNALRMQAEQERLNKTEEALASEQGTNKALAAKNSKMSKDQKLNAIYEEARTKFSSDEAEVYKQGKSLVIRLRSLEFPKSQAVIKGENFALLKKVEDVIQSFDKSTVMVEGHTDSTGGRAINQKLSNERAEAVKQYLEANSSDKVSSFESKGFGYEKPLTSNKTSAGRAQNRRVDVIIEPTQL